MSIKAKNLTLDQRRDIYWQQFLMLLFITKGKTESKTYTISPETALRMEKINPELLNVMSENEITNIISKNISINKANEYEKLITSDMALEYQHVRCRMLSARSERQLKRIITEIQQAYNGYRKQEKHEDDVHYKRCIINTHKDKNGTNKPKVLYKNNPIKNSLFFQMEQNKKED